MKRTFLLIIFNFLIIANISNITAQSRKQMEFKFLPSGLLFPPLKANLEEPRIGVLYFFDNANLLVDIGNSSDLFAFEFPTKKIKIHLGMSFFAYALATSYSGYRLQIDALDGFFGGYASFLKHLENADLLARLRIIHNSAHLVDGHYNEVLKKWINGIRPVPFTRDMGELTVAYEFPIKFGRAKYYGSISYATLVRPLLIKKYSFSAGVEFSNSHLIKKVFNHSTNLFFAIHFTLKGTPKYNLNSNTLIGIKFGNWEGKGIVFYLSYYRGKNFLNEYYYKNISKAGIGFFVDFN
jgi:hypothetical protein